MLELLNRVVVRTLLIPVVFHNIVFHMDPMAINSTITLYYETDDLSTSCEKTPAYVKKLSFLSIKYLR